MKKWVVKRLEDISDADSDVLADYVLALIRSDAPDEEIRRASIENLEDFLRENTVQFVDEIFATFGPNKVEPTPTLPQPPPQPQFQAIPPQSLAPPVRQPLPFNPPVTPSQPPAYVPPVAAGPRSHGHFDGAHYSRKRPFNEGFHGDHEQTDSSYGRSFKTPRTRRGGGRGDRMMGGGRDGHVLPNSQFPQPLPGFQSMPPGFPNFDQNNPMTAMLALQNVGFPQLPGFPPLPIPPPTGPPRHLKQNSQSMQNNQPCPVYETQGICYLGAACPYQHGRDPLVVSPADNEYDPTNANILIDVQKASKDTLSPSRGTDRSRGRGRGRGDRGTFPSRGRGRAEFSFLGPNEDKSITTIVVENIPEERFYEQIVRGFFSEFGNIVEVTMQAYKHLALVKYDSYAAAKRAWSSPKAVFDNRFVKVYWYKPTAKTETNGAQRPPSGTPTNTQADGTMLDKGDFGKQQAEAQRAHEERMKKRKETAEAKLALEKQREELLKKQQEEKAKLLEKLGKQDSVHEQTNGHNDDSLADDKASEKTKSLRAQLAALEAEAKSLGIDPNSADSEPSSSYRGRGRGWPAFRGRGWYAPRGRGYDPSHRGGHQARGALRGRGGVLRLDNRPKRVAVSGIDFTPERDEALRQHLIGIGEYESIEPNPESADSQIVNFKDRYVAEKLMYGPSYIPSVGKVEFSWVANLVGLPIPSGGSAEVKKDEDYAVMGNGSDADPSDPGNMRKDGNHEVDYDVAEVDDGWGIE